MEERDYYLGFALTNGIGPKRFVSLFKSFDEIVRRSKLSSSEVGSLLSMMGIKGIIKNSDGLFQLAT